MNLSLAVTEAAKNFHTTWRGLLGLDFNPTAPKEHWTRVKALSRRLAEGWADEYDNLKPVADLRFAATAASVSDAAASGSLGGRRAQRR